MTRIFRGWVRHTEIQRWQDWLFMHTQETSVLKKHTCLPMSQRKWKGYLCPRLMIMECIGEIFVIDDIEAWSLAIRSRTVIRTGKKCCFVDSSIKASWTRFANCPHRWRNGIHPRGWNENNPNRLFERLITLL